MRRRLSSAWTCVALGIAGGLLVGAGTLVIAPWWVTRSVKDVIHDRIDQVPVRDVAIVPGLGAKNGKMGNLLVERLSTALALYRAHKVQVILVSGIGAGPHEEIPIMRGWLRGEGVAPQHIVSDPSGLRTLDTMQRAARLLRVGSAVVCTQRMFMSRSIFLARGAGIDAVGLVAPERQPLGIDSLRIEGLKKVLAVIETYVLHRGARVWNMDGVEDGRATDRTWATLRLSAGPIAKP